MKGTHKDQVLFCDCEYIRDLSSKLQLQSSGKGNRSPEKVRRFASQISLANETLQASEG